MTPNEVAVSTTAETNHNELAPADSLLSLLERAAADPRIDADKLTKLLELRERLDARVAEQEFTRDFAAAKAEMPRVVKNGLIDMAGKGKIPFARYEDIDRAIRPIELKYGFTRSFLTEPAKEPGILMTVKLGHRSGHSERSTRFMPPDPGPGRNNMQAIGSASQYAKRYLTLDIWDIVTEGIDNDGNGADPINEKEQSNIIDLLAELDIKEGTGQMKNFLKFAKAASIQEIQRHWYPEVLLRLQEKLAEKRRGA